MALSDTAIRKAKGRDRPYRMSDVELADARKERDRIRKLIKARIYSPTLGRFLQIDPIGYKDQINLYEYVGDDPVDHDDPSGMYTSDDYKLAQQVLNKLEEAAQDLSQQTGTRIPSRRRQRSENS